MPTALSDLTAAVVDGIIYLVSGDNLFTPFTAVQAYDPASDTWSVKASIPAPLSDAAAGAINGRIYVVGGSLAGTTFGTNEVYDPHIDSWTGARPIPIATGGGGSAVVDHCRGRDTFFVIGGSNGSSSTNANQGFTL